MGTHPIFESDFDCLTEMDRTEQLAKLENYRRKRAEERQRKLTERPPWRPTGRATSASQQRQAATTSYRTSRTR